jgi:3-phenylpropionate/trans-cinnamate dioxygenase ferredoxin subunit
MDNEALNADWHRIAGTGDLEVGEAIPFELMGLQLALYHVEGAWFCTDNVCSHAYALLTDGWLDGHIIECPLHNGQFDVRTGKGQGAPITADIRTYRTRVDGVDVLVAIP